MMQDTPAAGYSQGAVIDGALVLWFILTVVAVAYVAWDALRNSPEMPVMKWGWILVTLYTGPVGAALYVLSCKQPGRGRHEEFIVPLWKQSLGSTIHCLAGDATGIIIAATVTLTLGTAMWIDIMAEYVIGFAVGLLIFQALFMRDMLGGSYSAAVKRSLIPEWLSMNAVMAGMIPVMVALMSADMTAMEPTSLRYWGAMSLATLAGFAAAYPVNIWLVAVGLKHGMGTVRVLARGGHTLDAERERIATVAGEKPAPTAATHGASTISHVPAPARLAPGPNGRQAAAVPPKLTKSQLAAVSLLTMLHLAAGLLVGALAGDLTMRPGMEAAAGHDMRGMSSVP